VGDLALKIYFRWKIGGPLFGSVIIMGSRQIFGCLSSVFWDGGFFLYFSCKTKFTLIIFKKKFFKIHGLQNNHR